MLMSALIPANAIEITAQRAVWSLLTCVIIVTAVRGWARLRAVLRSRRAMTLLVAAALLIATNWLVYVYSVVTDRVSSASLGYYINPLVMVALGVLVLGERLRRWQLVAVGIATVAVIVVAIEMRSVPWISLVLAVSFGLYGLLKKSLGEAVDPITGLTVETIVLAPVAAVALWLLARHGTLTFGTRGEPGLGLGHDLLLASTGLFTVGVLLLFAAGAGRLPLKVTGMLQYITPTMMFVLAVWHFGEDMPPGRWAGFALVWVALVVLSVDALRSRPRRRDARVVPPEPV